MFLATHGVLRRESAFVPPVFANTYSFEYTTDYIDCGDSDDFSFGNGSTDSPFSISIWVKMDDADKFRAICKYGATNIEYLLATTSDDKIVFYLYQNSTNARIGRQYSTALTSFEGQWIHLAATYNGNSSTSGLKIYLDGTRVDDTNVTSGTYVAMENTSQPLFIGKLTTTYANGKIDEPAIFDYELTSTEVSNIYGSGVVTDISSLNPVGHWRAENGSWDGSKWTITDAGSGGNDAESVSMSLASRSTDVPT